MNEVSIMRFKQKSFRRIVNCFIFMGLFLLYTFKPIPQITWTGSTDTDWETPTNWVGGVLPTSNDDVIIPDVTNQPIIGIMTNAECNNLSIQSGSSLTIKSESTSTGSLIVQGIATGTVTAQRYMTTGMWHHISSPIMGQSIQSFLNENLFQLSNQNKSNDNRRSMKIYDEATDNWGPLFTTSTSGNLDDAKGYSMWVNSSGTISFSGTLRTGSTNIDVTHENFGWNLVGNPYSSAIAITKKTGKNCFLSINKKKIDGSYAAIYLWDGSVQNYIIINNSGNAKCWVQMGQAFIVKVKIGETQLDFTPGMQQHQNNALLKSGEVEWPEIKLKATLANFGSSTLIRFNEEMSLGLDTSYDAGILKTEFNLYTKLVDDNGIDFGIQCLPETYDSLIIPLGIDSKTGGEITFSAETLNLPATCSVIIEDKSTGTFNSLDAGDLYKATLADKTTGTGRFYLHTSQLTTGITSQLSGNEFKLKAYQANSEIIIEGEVRSRTQACLFDINGRKLGQYKLQEGNYNRITTPQLASGIYLLNVTEPGKAFNTKIAIY